MTPPRVVGPEAAGELAGLHAAAFEAPWPGPVIADLLVQPGVVALAAGGGFLLVRVVADEAEILTLAVRPPDRRRGLARALVEAASAQAERMGAGRMFLEVAVGNAPARGLYGACGFAEVGRRRAYYARPDGTYEDALILALNLR